MICFFVSFVLLSMHIKGTLSNDKSTLKATTTYLDKTHDLVFPVVILSASSLIYSSKKYTINQTATATKSSTEEVEATNNETTKPVERIYTSTIDNVNISSNQKNSRDNSAFGSSFDRIFHEQQFVQDVYGIPCLSPIGIIGNGLVARIFLKKDVSNSGKRYLVFILLSDLLGLVADLFLPISRILAQQESWNLKVLAANMYFWNSDGLSFFFRRLNLNVFTVLSFERFTAIRKPLELKMSYTVTHFHVFIILCFLFSIVQTLPIVILVHMVPIYDHNTDYTSFTVLTRFEANKTQLFAFFVSRLFDGPFQIITFTLVNIMIIVHLAKRRKSSALSCNKDKAKQASTQQMKLLKVFMTLSLTNILAFLPQCGASLYSIFMHTGKEMEPIVRLLVSGTHLLRVLNSVTDFIVFVVISKEVRGGISNFFKCRHRLDVPDDSMQQQDVLESSETQITSLSSI